MAEGEMCVFGVCALFFFLLCLCGGKERNGKLVKQAEQWECSGGKREALIH